MKINFYGYQLGFKGRREDRNATAQLKNKNDYALTEPNQRRISQAIENLSQYSDEKNVEFLLDVADNLQYGVNIHNGKPAKNDWKAQLKTATEQSLASNPILKEKYEPKFNQVFNTQKPLTETEKSIISLRNSIMNQADLDSIKDNKNENIRSLERNIDYFVSSSEIPTDQKLYVLDRLNYFMSQNYEINPQLEGKRTQILAEMMNDLAVNTAESKVPNIKAINQKNHGMCAAISIVRKAIAYEDKPNYVDSILSELDSSPNVMVYDRFNLGSGKRIPVKKAYLDFDYATSKGYRIVDASATQWMNIADMYGINNESLHDYNPFDKYNFDAFQDAHFMKNFADDRLMRKQSYYQSLMKAQSDIGKLKSSRIKNAEKQSNTQQNFWKNINQSGRETAFIREELKALEPQLSSKEINSISSELISLQKPISEKIQKGKPEIAKYSFIPNEEDSQKLKKVKAYLTEVVGIREDEKLDKAAQHIKNAIIEIHQLSDKISPTHTMSKNIADARAAYEAEAIYRVSVLLGLNETDVQTDYTVKYNVPDRESRISTSLGKLITLLEKDDTPPPKLLEHVAAIFAMDPNNKAEVIRGVQAVKANFDSNMTEGFDDLFERIGLGSRQDILLDEVQACKEEVKSGDKKEQGRLAEVLNISNDKKSVLNQLEKFEKELLKDNLSHEKYLEIFNKLGYKDQIAFFVDKFKEVLNSLTNPDYPDREENLKMFKELHNLAEDASTQDILNVFSKISDDFNALSKDTEIAANIIDSVTAAENNVLSEDERFALSINAKEVVMKKMVDRGELVPDSVMRKLQERFVKIDKIKSADEFQSRQGKISQPELYKLTPAEKEAIKQINKKSNKMYADVTRALTNTFREIKPDLEEHARKIGTSTGSYWVSEEGHSGLFSPQQVKIFEQITDRPYYAEENIDTSVDKIIKGTHSGISGTSVFHDRYGGHAQYIVDIKKEGPDGKYALFHDNSWGASEHENTWVDSEGITRTDYSDRRGGDLGYITNAEWRNGNYVENLKYKKGAEVAPEIESKAYKKLNSRDYDGFEFQLMYDAIIVGKDPKHKSIAGSIKDSIYIPDRNYINSLGRQASNMTMREIEKAGMGLDAARELYKERFESILKRIQETPFNSGFKTQEEYDNLPYTDPLKLSLEKTAVKMAYPSFYMYDAMGKATTIEDVRKIEEKLKENARNDFNYAFGKEKEILLYYAYEHARETSGKLIQILDNNKVKYEFDAVPKVFTNTAIFEKGEEKLFTGSMKDSINFVIDKTMKLFDENIPAGENTQKAKEEFKNSLTEILNDIMYFNKEDLNSEKFRAQSIRSWIDRTFEPKDDEEFIQIYRKLQDMTTEEFNKYTSNLKNEDLGIKAISGYDILRRIKAADENAENALRNVIFYEDYVKNVKLSETEPAYKYTKVQKSLRGATYKSGRTFEDIYTSFYSALDSLQYEKAFNEYKDRNYRKYKALPAYPKIELVTQTALQNKMESINKLTTETLQAIKMRKNVMASYNLVQKMKGYVARIPSDKPLTKQASNIINSLVGEFVTNNYNDPDLADSLDAAYSLLSMPENSTAGDYKKLIAVIVEDFKMIEKTNQESPFKELNKANIQYLNEYFNGLLSCNIPPRYRSKLREDINNWIKEEFKKKDMTLERQEGIVQLRAKLDEMSIPNQNKGKLHTIDNIQMAINTARFIKDSEEFSQADFDERVKTAHEFADKYITEYIKPEQKQHAQRLFDSYIKRGVNMGKQKGFDLRACEAAKNKFFADFQKHHYCNNPIETLKSYVMSAAKDSKTADFKNNYKSLLENNLNFATLVDIQDLIMKAVKTGNAAEVRKYFKDYYVYPFSSPFPLTMDSPESLSYIIKNLLINNNNETAKMFVEKLGLAETVIDFEAEEFDGFNVDKRVKSIIGIATATQKNLKIARNEIEKLLKEVDKSEDHERLIDETKMNIIQKSKKNKRQTEVKRYLEALDTAKESLRIDPEMKRTIVVAQEFEAAIQDVINKSNEESVGHQQFLNMIMLLYSFLADLNIPEYSEAYKKQEALTNKFLKFRENYEESLRKLQEVCDNVQVSGINL